MITKGASVIEIYHQILAERERARAKPVVASSEKTAQPSTRMNDGGRSIHPRLRT
jgi:hypothetical protein